MSDAPRSVCPVCLAAIPALHVTKQGTTFLVKSCPEHGEFRTVVWRGEPSLASWSRPKIPSPPKRTGAPVDKGCPYDCGLCAAHRQHTCTALVEITWRCDQRCPVCFASAGESPPPDPKARAIDLLLDGIMEQSGPCNLQFSGGEPTMRGDLPQLIALAKAKGFPFVQLNTNGLRIACEDGYARLLADAGLDSVFLSFDGVSDASYETLRGHSLLQTKLQAIETLAKEGVGVVLVPTVMPGVNDHELGGILKLAASLAPGVRGVHFQPVSYFGRYPKAPADEERITLPDVMRALEKQTGGMVHAADFLPPGCEHAHCSFHANYLVKEDGGLHRLSGGRGACDCSPHPAREGADQAKAFVRRQWAAPAGLEDKIPEDADDLDRFLARARTHILAVSGMAFQDAWTLDMERLKGCCIHVAAPDGTLVPFCAYNLTAMDGTSLYRATSKLRRTHAGTSA